MVDAKPQRTARAAAALFVCLAAGAWFVVRATRDDGAGQAVAPPPHEESTAPASPDLRPPEVPGRDLATEREVAPVPDETPEDVEEPEEEVAPPPDPIERGECALFLQLFDAETREPVRSRVQLWRLDAPGNEGWTRGDRLQATLDVGDGGRWFRELPAGRYRARCEGERRTAEDPPEFLVECPTTSHHLDLTLPRTRDVTVRLFTASGDPVRRAEFRLERRGANSRSANRPSWVTHRTPKNGALTSVFGMGGGWSGRVRGGWRTLDADAAGRFSVGTCTEGTRTSTPTYVLEARAGDLAPVYHDFDGDADTLDLVSVLVDPAPVQASVLAPDGRTCAELADGLRITAGAVGATDDEHADRERVVIEASRRWKDDYQDLEFEFRVTDLPLPTRHLESKAGSSPR